MTERGPHVLLLTHAFPPLRSARSLQIGKLVKYAMRAGARFDVVTGQVGARLSDATGIDDAWLAESDGLNIRTCGPNGRSAIDRLRNAMFCLPDRRWERAACEAARTLIADRGPDTYDAMVSFFHPTASHAVALAVKKRHPELPWLAHFADPLAGNPFIRDRIPWHEALRRRREHSFIEHADGVLFVGEQLLSYVMGRYPEQASKAKVLFHVFDPELYPSGSERRRAPGGVLKLAYVGGFTSTRSYRPILTVVKHLEAGQADLSRVQFEFVGGQTREAAEVLNRIRPNLAFSVGAVDYLESLRRMRDADCLILVDANMAQSPFYPSKLADYFGSLRPVLGISPPHSYSTELLRRHGMPVFDYDHLDQCAALVAGWLSSGKGPEAIRPETVSAYEASHVAERFLEIVRSRTAGEAE